MGNLNTNHRVKDRYKTQSGHKTWTLSNILYLYDQIISLYLVGPKIETMNLIITVVNCPVNFNLINIICTFGLNSPWRLFVLSGRLITSLQNISGLQLVNIMHFKQAFFLFQSICSYRLMTWVFGFLWSCSKLLKLWLLEYTVCFCWLTPIKVKIGEWNWLNWIFFNCIYLLLVNWEVDFNMHNKKSKFTPAEQLRSDVILSHICNTVYDKGNLATISQTKQFCIKNVFQLFIHLTCTANPT